jgi:DNA ligase-1
MNTEETLVQLSNLVTDLNKTNGANDKMETLALYPECKKILNYVYDPMKMYGVTSDNVKKLEGIEFIHNELTIFELLDKLSNKELTGHRAIGYIKALIINNIQHLELIYNIIDKDLKIGMGTSNINKVFKDLIPKFDVALANSYSKVSSKVNLEDYYGSHKLDGLRCIAIKKGDNVRFFSRQGKEFFTLDYIQNSIIRNITIENCVFDGELCIVDEKGKEDFTKIMKVYKKKDFTIPNPKYKIFDMLTIEEFESKTSTRIFSERLLCLQEELKENNDRLEVLEQIKMTPESFETLQAKSIANGWEGLILRKDTVYKGKRSNDILKVKKFFDAEYEVLAIETGLFQVVELGTRKEIETLTAIHIEHKGFDVKVGSGFTIEQRKLFYNNPSEIIGKTISVQYFEETTNEKGKTSLRFPTLKHIYENGREV